MILYLKFLNKHPKENYATKSLKVHLGRKLINDLHNKQVMAISDRTPKHFLPVSDSVPFFQFDRYLCSMKARVAHSQTT
jgi:hypothetical protein